MYCCSRVRRIEPTTSEKGFPMARCFAHYYVLLCAFADIPYLSRRLTLQNAPPLHTHGPEI